MIMRRALILQFLRSGSDHNDVLGTNWNWVERVVYDGGSLSMVKEAQLEQKQKDMMSTVQGHIHTQAYTEWMVGRNFRFLACKLAVE